MKKSFKEIIDNTFKNKTSWNYYGSKSTDFNYNPMESLDNSKKFLKDFIEMSGKEKNELYKEIDNLDDRATHVVSAFFIGHYIYENTQLKNLIDKEISKLIEVSGVKSDINFSFIWYLTCLFHDLGYNIEKSSNLKFENIKSLEDSLDHKLFGIIGIPKFYNQIYKNYFKYRINESNKNDHGIVAGHFLFNSLYKIRELASINPNKSQKKLCWEEALLHIYNFCAWNIIGHNIWYGSKCKAEDFLIYSKYRIKNLLLKCGEIKINQKKNPFFFFFCLVDTIEPYKKVLNYNSLENVFLELTNNKIIISTDLKCKCGKDIIKQANSLNNWLIKTEKTHDEEVVVLL